MNKRAQVAIPQSCGGQGKLEGSRREQRAHLDTAAPPSSDCADVMEGLHDAHLLVAG